MYLIFALIFGFAYRYVINPDGISQLRLAGYLAEGNFQQSVVSGWSPLMIWVFSPFLYLGIDGLIAARIAIALCGAGLLVCSWFLTLRFNLSANNSFIATLLAALLISFWNVFAITSDVLVAALTLFYIYLVTEQDILKRQKISFLCGIAGGFSYLAHHYALPFFLAHFPAILLLRGYIDRDKEGLPWEKVFISLGIGMAGFLIISSIWIGVVSAKYGQLAISSKGGAAHAIMGPKDIDRRHPFFVGGLFKPRDAYAMHVFEDPSNVKFKTWSPFESREYFIHQLNVIKGNAIYILNHFVNNSPFFTYAFVIGVLAFIPVAFLLNPLNNRKKFLYSWVIMTFCIYSSGFLLLIARSPRRFYALMVVFLFISFHFLEEMKNALGDIVSGRRKNLLAIFLLIIVVSAFALKPGAQLFKSIRYLVTHEQVNPYAEIAEDINTVEFQSPYAIIRSSQKPHTDTFIAYYLGKQLLGRPLSSDPDGITSELAAAGARSLLVFDNPEIVEELKSDNRYVHLAHKELDNGERYEHTVNINIRDHEVITGWDNEVNIFSFK
jgi:hypothetical protein